MDSKSKYDLRSENKWSKQTHTIQDIAIESNKYLRDLCSKIAGEHVGQNIPEIEINDGLQINSAEEGNPTIKK